jgi:hypothetical protein
MSGLRRIVQDAADRRLDTGGAISTRVIAQLRHHRRQQLVVFVALELALVLGVAFCAYYAVRVPANTVQLKVLTGLIGVGAGGGIEVMRRIWKEWSQTALLLLLLEEASEAQVTAVINRLVGKL